MFEQILNHGIFAIYHHRVKLHRLASTLILALSALLISLTLATGAARAAEFPVNTITSGNQQKSSMEALTGGGFVIAWQDDSDATNDIRSQRYDAAGVALGLEFLVNTIAVGSSQSEPRVAALSGGGFVIAWTDNSATLPDNSGFAIRAQRYDALGMALGSEFVVNATTFSDQSQPSVVGLSGGGFVVAWMDFSGTLPDNSASAIRARRYDATGMAQGSDFVVNATSSGGQNKPNVAALSGDGFVIAWTDFSFSPLPSPGDTSGGAIRAQRYDATGTVQGAEFLVNTITANNQKVPSAAGLSGGGFVIAWEDFSTTASGIRAQRYDATGAALGEFLVNTTNATGQTEPSVIALSGGGFVIAWTDFGTVAKDVLAQRYDATGAVQGSEFVVNTRTSGGQSQPSTAGLSNGNFAIAWTDSSGAGPDISGSAVRADIFVVPAPEIRIDGIASLEIISGDTTPSATDGTDFGSLALGSSTSTIFFIVNSPVGAADLILGTVTITGANAADFTITTLPSSPVTIGSFTTFVIQFTPSVAGLRTATVNIPNNDPDENPYTFAILGHGPQGEVIFSDGFEGL